MEDSTSTGSGRSSPQGIVIPPLHLELIEYVMGSTKMFFFQDLNAWSEWTTKLESAKDLSDIEVRDIFLTQVLPKVNAYELPKTLKNRLVLLNIHPLLRRVADGYEISTNSDLASRIELEEDKDYIAISKFKENGYPSSAPAILIDDKSVVFGPQMDPEFLALLSMMVSTDLELSMCQLHSTEEIHSRLRQARQNFEDRARFAPLRNNLDETLYKLEVFNKLRKNICLAMNYRKKY
ncbi:uncharacterized protein [Drosophila bipectinata]|uniref:uncharacterized protein n=1 Tax=Drosophila bipectinata TaxID=42026 RepID=UPI001C890817|nr:uncharacterized protein LOC108133524 [Drosophila bipectinata]